MSNPSNPSKQLVFPLTPQEIQELVSHITRDSNCVISRRLNRGVCRAWSGNPLLQFMTPEQIKVFVVNNMNRMLNGFKRKVTIEKIAAYIDEFNFRVNTRLKDGVFETTLQISFAEQNAITGLDEEERQEMSKVLKPLRNKVIHELLFPRRSQLLKLLRKFNGSVVNYVEHQGGLSLILALP